MKKICLIFGVAATIMLCNACGGIDSKITAYEKACESGDYEKIKKALSDLGDYRKDEFTPKQKIRFAKVSAKCAKENLIDPILDSKE